MGLELMSAVLPSVISGIGGIASAGINMSEQKATQKYNRDLQQQIFDREDNAVQRRVADLEQSGFSKWSAVDNPAATASGFTEHSSPQVDMSNALAGVNSLGELLLGYKNSEINNKQTESNVMLQEYQALTEVTKALNNNKNTEHLEKVIEQLTNQITFDSWKNRWYMNSGLPPGENLKSNINIKGKVPLFGELSGNISVDDLRKIPGMRQMYGVASNASDSISKALYNQFEKALKKLGISYDELFK